MDRTGAWLLLVVLLGAALRLFALDFGLDLHDPTLSIVRNQADELGMAVDVAEAFFVRADLQPDHFLNWGTAGFWIFGLTDRALVALLQHVLDVNLSADRASELTLLLLTHRWISALASLATLLVLLTVARRELGARGQLLAGALLACCYLHVRESHFGTLDSLLALFTALAWERCLAWRDGAENVSGAGAAQQPVAEVLRCRWCASCIGSRRRNAGESMDSSRSGNEEPAQRSRHPARMTSATGCQGAKGARGRWLRPALAGLWVGLATATKFSGLTLALLPALAARARWADARSRSSTLLGLGLGMLCALLGYRLASPHLFFAPEAALAQLELNAGQLSPGLADLPALLWRHLSVSLGVGLGLPALVLAAVGGLVLLRQPGRGRSLLLLSLTPLVVLLVVNQNAVRYALPGMAPLCLLAAAGLEALVSATAQRRPGLQLPVLVALLLLALGPSLVRSLTFLSLVSQQDTRVDVMRFLREQDAQASDVAAFGLHGLPVGSRHQTELPFVDMLRATHPWRDERVKQLLQDPPRFVVHERNHALLDRYGFDALRPLLAERYELVLDLDGRKDRATPPLPDEQAGSPSFLVPFAQPWLMLRPGPALEVYRRREP